MKLTIEEKAIGHDHCKECGGRIPRGDSTIAWCCQKMRLCRYCYRAKFPRRKNRLPPLSRRVKGGWQALVSAEERLRWQRPYDEVIERLDRKNGTTDYTD